jgi:hypothetical protein
MPRPTVLPSAVAALGILLALAGCSGAASSAAVTVTVSASTPSASPSPSPSQTPTPSAPADAAAVAATIKAAVASVTKVVVITENNDPNNMIGRPTGYTSAAVLYDFDTKCSSGLGADCGATVEGWPTAADAKARAAYIEGNLKKMPMLGTEYDTVKGTYLLRVSGALKPSQAKKYSAAFAASF